jgi:ribosomal protein L11 methyltransferase
VPVIHGSIEALDGLQQRPADLLLCNILGPVIEALAPSFGRILAPSGQGLLSGLLVDQAPSLVTTLAGCGWHGELIGRQEPWGLMRIRQNGQVT